MIPFHVPNNPGNVPTLPSFAAPAAIKIAKHLFKRDKMYFTSYKNIKKTHRINAVERPIQMFKDAFFATLATTNSDFPLQLWDRLTPQVLNFLNMMRPSHINPSKFQSLCIRHSMGHTIGINTPLLL